MLDLHPYTLLWTILVVLIFKHTVNAVGKTVLQDHGWTVYTRIAPKLGHTKFIELASKQRELVEVTKQKKQISAQDEYAKWTKLNRQADKLAAEVASLNETVSSDKAWLSRYIGLAITAVTSLPIWFCRVWLRKSVLFYLPKGVLPYYIEWVLAIPFFSVGSVGLTIWMMSLNSVILSLIFLVTFPFSAEVEKPKPTKTVNEPEKTENTQ